MRLQGRVALITGAGSGIGRAIACRFSQEGATVFVNDLIVDRAKETARLCDNSRTHLLPADVSNSRQVCSLFKAIDLKSKHLDILVNNAGIAESRERWHDLNRRAEARLAERARDGKAKTLWNVTIEMSKKNWHAMMRVHLDGTFLCSREALKRMSRDRTGAIINLSSTAALTGLPDAPHYAAAKAGVLGFTRSLAREVADQGIRVNALAPGFIETPMTAEISSTLKAQLIKAIPAARWGTPEEIAAIALFLASDDSAYITGQCLSPNGGML